MKSEVRRQSKPNSAPPPPFDERLRYSIKDVCWLLRTSKPSVYGLIRAGRLTTFKDGRRTFVTGASIVRASAPPESSAA
jgi:excisionase family DNA binding protein